MKKKIFPFAVLAATLVSCSQDELAPAQPNTADNPNVISFVSATTRATVNNLDAMKSNTTGFTVYATGADATGTWYTGVDGTNNYKATGGIWDWATNTSRPQWPTATETGKWPMKFYAYFPDDAGLAGFTPSITEASVIKAEIAVEQTIAGQTDFLAAKAEVSSKPTTGFLPLNFKHIMSKVGFKITQETTTETTIAQLGFEQIGRTRTYNYIDGNWEGTKPTANGSFQDYITYTLPMTGKPGTGAAQAVRPDGDNHFFMFVPQTGGSTVASQIPVWDGTGTAADGEITPNGAYIQMLYRTNESTGTPKKDILGFAQRSSHDVETEWDETANQTEYDKYKKGGSYTDGLYLKVGFKLTSDTFNWEAGKGYTYNLLLNQAGGIYLSKYYYDKDGQNTKIPVVGGNVDPGDPVFGEDIMFTVTETEWDDQADTNIQ